MKVFLSYSTNSHFGEARKKFAEFLAEAEHTLITADFKDPTIPIFKKENVEVIPNVDTTSFTSNSKSLLSIFNKSDLVVFFPGGLNTSWMLSSVLHHAYYGKINKPIIIVNLDGFFDNFINTIKVSLHEEPLFKNDVNWYYVANDFFSARALINQFSVLKPLNSVVHIGDYVDYPVKYENVVLPNGQKSELSGWRVIDIAQNHVRLISAGTPLSISFKKEESIKDFIFKLQSFNEFLENGFKEKILDALFNKYTLYHDILSYDDIRFNSQDSLFYNGTDVFVLSSNCENLLTFKNTGIFDAKPNETFGVRIIVTLKSDTMTVGKNRDNVWILS